MPEQSFTIGENYPDIMYDLESGVLPPDMFAMWQTFDLAQAIRLHRYAVQNTEKVVRVAIAGGGIGTDGAALIGHLLDAQEPFADGPLEFEVFDNNPGVIEAAKSNIAAYGRYMVNFSANVFQGDWNDVDLWRYFQDNPVHFLLANPPYLADAQLDSLPPQYEHTSRDALSGGKDGLDHIRTLISNAPSVLIDEDVTGVFLRYSKHADDDELERIIASSFGYFHNASLRRQTATGPGYGGFFMRMNDPRRSLTMAEIPVRRVSDMEGRAVPMSSRLGELSIRHAAVLDGVILGDGQYREIEKLRRIAKISFAEEQQVVGAMRTYHSLRGLTHFGWKRLVEKLGEARVIELEQAVVARS
jgi:methylase of polypeptide subunit release factors